MFSSDAMEQTTNLALTVQSAIESIRAELKADKRRKRRRREHQMSNQSCSLKTSHRQLSSYPPSPLTDTVELGSYPPEITSKESNSDSTSGTDSPDLELASCDESTQKVSQTTSQGNGSDSSHPSENTNLLHKASSLKTDSDSIPVDSGSENSFSSVDCPSNNYLDLSTKEPTYSATLISPAVDKYKQSVISPVNLPCPHLVSEELTDEPITSNRNEFQAIKCHLDSEQIPQACEDTMLDITRQKVDDMVPSFELTEDLVLDADDFMDECVVSNSNAYQGDEENEEEEEDDATDTEGECIEQSASQSNRVTTKRIFLGIESQSEIGPSTTASGSGSVLSRSRKITGKWSADPGEVGSRDYRRNGYRHSRLELKADSIESLSSHQGCRSWSPNHNNDQDGSNIGGKLAEEDLDDDEVRAQIAAFLPPPKSLILADNPLLHMPPGVSF
ncbi:unnamed protein product [Protopolystoma xenopodis]|uniref:Uncharacterized protein n=1 Tax=Protopolystoma xenopodis TaxID=117903 RepID=A0A3S5BB34_9PLAT|nr:unnamed protein product [Protopolystoma xenopodis]